MTPEEFAEALLQLIEKGWEGGLPVEAIIAGLELAAEVLNDGKLLDP